MESEKKKKSKDLKQRVVDKFAVTGLTISGGVIYNVTKEPDGLQYIRSQKVGQN